MKVKRMTHWTSTVLLALGLFDYRHVEGAGGRSAARASVCAAEGMGLCPGVFQYDWCGCLAFGMWRPGVARSSGAQLRGVSGGFVGIASAQPYSGHALFGYHPPGRAADGHTQSALFVIVMMKGEGTRT